MRCIEFVDVIKCFEDILGNGIFFQYFKRKSFEVTKQMNQFKAFDIENNSGIIDAFDKQTSKNNSRAAVALVSIYLQYSLYKEMYFDIVF